MTVLTIDGVKFPLPDANLFESGFSFQFNSPFIFLFVGSDDANNGKCWIMSCNDDDVDRVKISYFVPVQKKDVDQIICELSLKLQCANENIKFLEKEIKSLKHELDLQVQLLSARISNMITNSIPTILPTHPPYTFEMPCAVKNTDFNITNKGTNNG